MKHLLTIIAMLLILNQGSSAQTGLTAQTSSAGTKSGGVDLTLVAYDSNDLLSCDVQKGTENTLGKNLIFIEEAIAKTDKCIYFTGQTNVDLQISEGMYLFYGVQSPYAKDNWVYLERNPLTGKFNFSVLNSKEGKKQILFTEANSPVEGYALMPFAFSSRSDQVFVQAVKFDGLNEHEGVFSFDLNTNEAEQIPVPAKYMCTPVLSPDRSKMAFTETDQAERNLAEGSSDFLKFYDLNTKKVTLVAKSKTGTFTIAGWHVGKIKSKNYAPANSSGGGSPAPMQLGFKLPWQSGLTYYISRAGSPAPTGAISSSCYYNYGYTPHTYVATDFDTPNAVYDAITAVADGTVSTVGWDATGYGNYVILTHSDGTQTLYGHLNSVSVAVNQTVVQGCTIGDGGTTGSSTGDHLHFEWRVGGVKQYATFAPCSCLPKPNYCYTSNNTLVSCCSYSLSSTSSSYGSSGGTNSVYVTTSGGCLRNPVSNASWVMITSASGTGSGYVNFSVTANYSASARSTTWTIGGQTHSVYQAGATLSCGTPTGLYSSGVYASGANMYWSAVSGASYYYVDVRPSYTSTYSTYYAGGTSLSVSGLSSGVTYYWRVRTYCSSGLWSSNTSEYAFTTTASCGTPSGLYSSGVYSTGANMYWSAVSGASYYYVDVRPSYTSTYSTYYAGGTSLSVSGLSSGVTYYWRVRTYCSSGLWSSNTSEYAFTTNSSCSPPTGLQTTSWNCSTIWFQYNVATGATGGYYVYLKPTWSSSWSYSWTNSMYNVYWSWGGLYSGTTYELKVYSVCSGGNSGFSPSIFFSTSTCRMSSDSSGIQDPVSSSVPFDQAMSSSDVISSKDDLKIFPSPIKSGEVLHIEGLHSETTIQIINTLGQIVLRSKADVLGNISVGETLTPGFYLLKDEESGKVEKLIVQ